MVSDGGSRGFLLVYFNASVKYLLVAIIILGLVAVGIMGLWVDQETFCPMRTEVVAVIQTLWQ